MNYTSKFQINKSFIPYTTSTPKGFEYDEIRKFQKEAIKWSKNKKSEPILVLQSPTGSGKTACFTEIIKDNNKNLIIYPTNSLLEQQKTIFDSIKGLNPIILNSNTIEGSGINRRNELKNILKSPKNNIILTNPDILQAILQGNYIDPNDSLIRQYFEYIDTVIYDEFHFYDEFETSGILLQLKLFTNRLKTIDSNPKIILSSATPNKSYLSYIENELNIPFKRVRASTEPNNGHTFRYKCDVEIYPEKLIYNFDGICQKLKNIIEQKNISKNKKEPKIALIFNSAKDSNRFQDLISNKYPEIHNLTVKDNGYDTYIKSNKSKNNLIYNTTTKGEVGLDYDIEYLFIDKPRTASSFIQRFGRAGRHSRANIYIYGFNDIKWNKKIDYSEFESKIYHILDTPQLNKYKMKNLIGLRAATAVYNRLESDNMIHPELYEDLNNIKYYNKWYNFYNEINNINTSGYATLSKNAKKIKSYINECRQKIIISLRGLNVTYDIVYNIGNSRNKTEYDLLTALSHYNIKEINNNEIILGKIKEKPDIKIQLKYFSDLTQDYYEYKYQSISEKYLEEQINNSNLMRHIDINKNTVLEFFNLLSEKSKIPNKIITPQNKIDLNKL